MSGGGPTPRGPFGWTTGGPAGRVLFLVLATAVALLLVGPRHDHTPAIVVIAVVIAIGAVSFARRGRR